MAAAEHLQVRALLPLTLENYHRLVEAGGFEGERVELLVEDPVFRDAGTGVQRRFDREIDRERRRRDLDHAERIEIPTGGEIQATALELPLLPIAGALGAPAR